MAEEVKESVVKSTVTNWVKGIVTSIFGLLSGAALMYLTPVVNNVVKPAKPIANFAAQVNGPSVQFNNRSTGGTEGWWDFGDGSALEPFDPKAENITHTYKKPGTYSAKLSLQNLIGESSERAAPVTVDADAPASKVELASFDLIPITPRETAPAVYRLQAKVAGATHCILCRGDHRPMEIIDDPNRLDQLISFDEMGTYTVRLAAVNGKQLIEKAQEIFVGANEGGELLAKVKVSYQAVRVERVTKTWRIHCGWQGDLNDPYSSFRRERQADPGTIIVGAEIVNKADETTPRNLECKLSEDRTKVVLTGELVRPTGVLLQTQTAPRWLATVKATLERRSAPRTLQPDEVTMAVGPGRSVKIPMQALRQGWEPVKAQVSMELWDGNRKIWSGEPPIANAAMIWKNQNCTMSAVQQSDGILVTISGQGVPATPVVLPKPVVDPAPALPMPPIAPPPVIEPAPMQSVGPMIRKVGYEFDPRHPFK
ncbi:MAG TPA: PKD domain-containing protein [Gemmataceae bacterium]|nr:PKD domain-containing protein [Gemmataceae bacterium]